MENGTGNEGHHSRSERRALVAAWLQEATTLDHPSAAAWADACTVLLEAGWAQAARALLAHLLDPGTAGRVWAVLAGGFPPATDPPAEDDARQPGEPPPRRPDWASASVWSGPGGSGQALYGREVFDLRATADTSRPHVRVLVYGTDPTPPTVLVEVSESGTPALLEPAEARRLAAAVTDAARLAQAARRGP